jgi:hypothetical protein
MHNVILFHCLIIVRPISLIYSGHMRTIFRGRPVVKGNFKLCVKYLSGISLPGNQLNDSKHHHYIYTIIKEWEFIMCDRCNTTKHKFHKIICDSRWPQLAWVRIPVEMWMFLFIMFLCYPVYVAALRRADPAHKESYRLSVWLRNCKTKAKVRHGLYRPLIIIIIMWQSGTHTSKVQRKMHFNCL